VRFASAFPLGARATHSAPSARRYACGVAVDCDPAARLRRRCTIFGNAAECPYRANEDFKMRTSLLVSAAGFVLAGACVPAHSAKELECQLTFSLAGWSAFYKTASGEGVVTCSDGKRLNVSIDAKGGGLTFGKSEIHDGIGRFSAVYDIEQVLGSYASAGAHAGAVNSAEAQALTKGPISLAISGKGQGWDLGVAFGKFTLTQR
jgi:hypothetical protein